MNLLVTTRAWGTRRRQYEVGDPVLLSALDADERLEGFINGAIVPARFVGTAAELTRRNPTPGAGVVCYATDTAELRIGDGVTAYVSLSPISGAGGDAIVTEVTITQQTGTTYTLALADAGTDVETTNAAAVTVTIPPIVDVVWPTGTIVNVRQYGTGQVTIAAGSGVTLRTPNGARTARQYSTASLTHRGSNEWIVNGDVSV